MAPIPGRDTPDRGGSPDHPIYSAGGVARPLFEAAVGGFLGAVTMTVYRLPLFAGLPPTAEFRAQLVGGDPAEYRLQALALQFLYGTAAGSVLGLVLSVAGRGPVEWQGHRATAAGAVYGVVLSVFGSSVVVRRLLGIEMERGSPRLPRWTPDLRPVARYLGRHRGRDRSVGGRESDHGGVN